MNKKNTRRTLLTLVISMLLILCFGTAAFADEIRVIGPGQSAIGPGRNGWEQTEAGWQYYQYGSLVCNDWKEIDGKWYWFDADGRMATGWISQDGKDYYLTQTETEGHPIGSLYENEQTPDGFQVDADGARMAASPNAAGRPNPYGRSCVEVDITNQMVYCYIGNELVVATPCVTGNAGKHDTSCGTWSIASKETSRYLQGTNDNGTKYKSFVNFWMPFHGGQGLHDASWRGTNPANFGGTIYQGGGSHGCVNLPYAAAAEIFNHAYVGMPVIVHT